ncbi:(2Fe-2S)-binding protein [Kaistia dalseonensis]|uniref:Carbon-monoxide dehydrogenase small subunit n=1 Tax=Kaistia dalseonensis TaxID=410840 RepID=A0ABU0HBX7_9HYPH|nr:(2Fe-2S)-binding protein [Kaistia dalseonensis]MCX5496398.1 (2Fe-2S)-binding protein [Kaistia dalseonensis]MDQ0439019.1 carbon-monoxide dehydrogenase small subunit [Kaistia dalseonensis]
MSRETVSFRLNGAPVTVAAAADRRLVDILRDDLALTATKAACRVGRCGSCMVLVNGEAVNSCLTMAWQLDGADVVSAEGLAAFPEADLVRSALAAEVSFQCGYCAPGFTVALTALLKSNPTPDEADIKAALEGNICRCTGYLSILRGAQAAVAALAAQQTAAE